MPLEIYEITANINDIRQSNTISKLVYYLTNTQKRPIDYLKIASVVKTSKYMKLDSSSSINLELVRTVRSDDRYGSLFWLLDKTKTAMGSRCLRNNIENPLTSMEEINRRYWEDEYYYLIAFDHKSQAIHHYRVDRMGEISITENPRQGADAFKAIRMEDYSARVFGMFGGQSQAVTLSFPDYLLDAMIDRFGKDLLPKRIAEGRLQIRAEVIPSSHFFGWLFSLGEQVRIEDPATLKEEYIAALKRHIN